LLLGYLVGGAQAQQQLPVVEKVEPPSWWAGHTINPVRLLVRGVNLHGARVTSPHADAIASGVVVNSAGTYLFVNVTVNPTAAPGERSLTLETPAGKRAIPFRLNAPLDRERGE